MKIKKIYSNNIAMRPILFNEGFCVVYGDVEKRNDRNEHNLGKTSLVHLIDFLLLKKGGEKHNIFNKYKNKFSGWIFFIELDLGNSQYLTIKRGVDKSSEVSFKSHSNSNQDFSTETSWDRKDTKLYAKKEENSVAILEEYLNFDVAADYGYRHFLAYLLRTQYDYVDVFKMNQFEGKDVDWKPHLFSLLGYSDQNVLKKYRIDIEIGNIRNILKTIVGGSDFINQTYTIKAAIAEREKEKKQAQDSLDKFDFYMREAKLNKELIEEIESGISRFNSERYRIEYEINKIKVSLENGPTFSLEEIKKVFDETKLYFPDDLKKGYQEVIEFNTNLSAERSKYLKEMLKNNLDYLSEIKAKLEDLNKNRQQVLAVLREGDTFKKYKALQENIGKINEQIHQYGEKLKSLDTAENYNQKKSLLRDESKQAAKLVKETIDQGSEIFDSIKQLFTEIYKDTMENTAVLVVRPNSEGNPEFEAKTLGEDPDQLTGKSEGYTSTKVQCAAFVLAILAVYSSLGKRFFKFAYYDGLFEGWGDNPKIKFIETIRDFSDKYDIQYIVSMIKSDVPVGFEFNEGEEIAKLDTEHTLFGINF